VSRSPGASSASGKIDFLNLIRGHIDHDAALTTVIPIQGMTSAPHLDFAGEVRAATKFPVFHAARIPDVATARHAIAAGKLDMVGMTRAHIADPSHRRQGPRQAARTASAPASAPPTALTASTKAASALCIHNAATGREETMPHDIPKSDGPPKAS
jgi:2,4-dienoyl-CoA reductase-like NADH-dependent reductase (Old Yellow Enzyme family)